MDDNCKTSYVLPSLDEALAIPFGESDGIDTLPLVSAMPCGAAPKPNEQARLSTSTGKYFLLVQPCSGGGKSDFIRSLMDRIRDRASRR